MCLALRHLLSGEEHLGSGGTLCACGKTTRRPFGGLCLRDLHAGLLPAVQPKNRSSGNLSPPILRQIEQPFIAVPHRRHQLVNPDLQTCGGTFCLL